MLVTSVNVAWYPGPRPQEVKALLFHLGSAFPLISKRQKQKQKTAKQTNISVCVPEHHFWGRVV